jgi:hypothetical protein
VIAVVNILRGWKGNRESAARKKLGSVMGKPKSIPVKKIIIAVNLNQPMFRI